MDEKKTLTERPFGRPLPLLQPRVLRFGFDDLQKQKHSMSIPLYYIIIYAHSGCHNAGNVHHSLQSMSDLS
jgi:hypothetical protein